MAENGRFAHIPTRVTGYARITSSITDAPRFSMAPQNAAPVASLEGAKLPKSVINFFLEMDRKIDMLLAQQSLSIIERDHPIKLDIREISGEGIRFLPTEQVEDGAKLEVVILLRQAPVRLVAAKGRASIHYEDDRPRYCTLDFASIRNNDLETLVSFAFEEEREQIRKRNKISG